MTFASNIRIKKKKFFGIKKFPNNFFTRKEIVIKIEKG
jgi:hypothetical protein